MLLGDENGSDVSLFACAYGCAIVALHNQFFLALLQNVHAAIIPKIIISRKDSGLGKDKSKKMLKRKEGGIQVRHFFFSSFLCLQWSGGLNQVQKKRKPIPGYAGLRPPDSAPSLRRFRVRLLCIRISP